MKKRVYYTYDFKVGNTIVQSGVTRDPRPPRAGTPTALGKRPPRYRWPRADGGKRSQMGSGKD